MRACFDRLWPLLRSLTGDGVRRTHDILGELMPLRRFEIPSGTTVFDWTVPREWVVREAYAIDPNGRRRFDVAQHNLHLVNYSVPFRGSVSRTELDAHLHSLPDSPDAIPYVTSYYEPRWGFCVSQRERETLPDGTYQVCIDTDLVQGSMTLSEAVLEGREQREVLFSTYTCHPSMANNELSGPLATAFLYRALAERPRRLTYRFVFLPETIGSLAYLQMRGAHLRERLDAGFVVTCVGLDAPLVYKRSRHGRSVGDRAASYVLCRIGEGHRVVDFTPASFSSDERQYCSPGFDLPVGAISREAIGRYPEYHTSLDNADLIGWDALVGTVDALLATCEALEANVTLKNLSPYGEPNLGKRGLYPTLGASRDRRLMIDATVWLLNLADGAHDLLAIAERSGMDLALLADRARACEGAGLLARVATASAA
jgi:aminopeptidase-like protein